MSMSKNPMACGIKSPRRFADGGVVDLVKRRNEQIEAAANYDTPQKATAPAQQAPSAGSQADDYAAQAARMEAEQLAAAKKKNIFGFAEGGKIKGPGTPKSDSIRGLVRETKEPIDVSTDERILSQSQDAALEKLAVAQGFGSLDAMLEAMTGTPVGPTIDVGAKKAANGMAPTTNPARRFAIGGLIDPERDYSMPEGKPLQVTPRAPTVAPRVSISQAFQADDASMRAADPAGYSAQAAKAQAESAPGLQERTFQAPNAPRGLASLANPITSPSIVGADNYRPNSAQNGIGAGLFSQDGKTYRQQPTKQDGISKITSPGTASLFTNLDGGAAVSSLKNPMTSINLSANNESMARANAIRQSMIDGDGTGQKVTMLGDSGRAESQALMDKWGRESQLADAGRSAERNPRVAQSIASLFGSSQGAEASRRGQDVNAGTTARGQDITAGIATSRDRLTARGQDLDAQTRAAQLAGNPLANELTKAQTAAIQSGLDDKNSERNMIAEMQDPKTTPERRKVLNDSILAGKGKTANDSRYIPQTIKTYNNMGQIDGERVVIFDKQTGQMVQDGSAAQGGTVPTFQSKADLQAAIKAGTIKPGQVVNTPVGQMTVK